MGQERRREPDERPLTAWPQSLIIRFNTLRRKPRAPTRKPVEPFSTIGKVITLPKAKNAPRAFQWPSGGIQMHPLLFILGFFAFILAIFGLMELHARSIIRKFEQTIKHSQE